MTTTNPDRASAGKPAFLVFDVETNDMPNWKLPADDPAQARIVQIGAMLLDEDLNPVETLSEIISPDGWVIAPGAEKAHGIPLSRCEKEGINIESAIIAFDAMADQVEANGGTLVAYNIKFDNKLVRGERRRLGRKDRFGTVREFDAMKAASPICDMPPTAAMIKANRNWAKTPKLSEAFEILTGKPMENAHDALADVAATVSVMRELRAREVDITGAMPKSYQGSDDPAGDTSAADDQPKDRPTPGIGDNSIPAGVMLADDPALVYSAPELLDKLVAEIKAEIAAHPKDTDSDKSRKALASLSASISRRKVPIVDAGKGLTENWRKKTAEVNATKTLVETKLDALRDQARKPLTDWEIADKTKKDRIASLISKIDSSCVIMPGATVSSLGELLEWLEGISITEDEFGEFEFRAKGAKETAISVISLARDNMLQAEKDRAELEQLRIDRAKREQDERDRQAKLDAEAATQKHLEDATKKAAGDAAAEERRKSQAALDEANERAAAAKREADAIKEAADRAEAKRIADQKKIDDDNAAEKAEDDRRAADQAHRGSIMRSAKEAIIEHGGIGEDRAKKIVLAIVAGSVPHISISF